MSTNRRSARRWTDCSLSLALVVVAVVLGTGCGPGGVTELWSDPDANEILRRHFNHINSKSAVRETGRIRVEGSMRMDNYVGQFSMIQNEQRHYYLQFSGKKDATLANSSSDGPSTSTLALVGGWNGRVEWAKVNGMLMKEEAITERVDNGVGLFNFTEKEMSANPHVSFVGRTKVRDRDAFIVEHRPPSGTFSKIHFDVENYEILSADITRPGRRVQFEFFDWKVVDGVYGPTRVTGLSDGKDLGMVVTGIDYDPTIDDAVFSP